MCKGKPRHCAVKLKIFGLVLLLYSRGEARFIYFGESRA